MITPFYALVLLAAMLLLIRSGYGGDCKMKKKIIVDTGIGGLGNRLIAIASTALLAIMTDRELEVIWRKTEGCNADFDDLFELKKPAFGYHPIVVNADDSLKDGSKNTYTAKACFIHLDAEHDVVRPAKTDVNVNFLHFHIMNNTRLLTKLNAECPIIHIHANMYFAELFLNPVHGRLSEYLRKFFPQPFRDIIESVLIPKSGLLQEVKEVKEQLSSNNGKGKWLSIQIRNKFAYNTMETFECAKRLLDSGQIQKIFIATDSYKVQQLAYKILDHEKDRIVTVKKHLLFDDKRDDNYAIRNTAKEVRIALLEWLLVGEADYCTSPSMKDSTFSKTALARGRCRVLDTGSCNINITNDVIGTNDDKDWIIYLEAASRGRRFEWLRLPKIGEGTVWSSVKFQNMTTKGQCIPPNVPSFMIASYWKNGDDRDSYKNKNDYRLLN